MEILIGFVELWLLCGCLGLVICCLISVVEAFRLDIPEKYEPASLIELFFVAIATFFLPLLGPFVLWASIEKLHKVVKNGQ